MAKYVARREKDIAFPRELARRGLVLGERLLALLALGAVRKASSPKPCACKRRDSTAGIASQ